MSHQMLPGSTGWHVRIMDTNDPRVGELALSSHPGLVATDKGLLATLYLHSPENEAQHPAPSGFGYRPPFSNQYNVIQNFKTFNQKNLAF